MAKKITFMSFLFLAMLSACQQQEALSPPNIIVIMADDLGYEVIGANGGSSYQTPHIDQLAAEGIRFSHCYSQPLCTPSRVQIMTGIYNIRNYVRFGLLHPSQTTFGHIFQQADYNTCIVGKWQLGKDPLSPHQAGFDEYCLWQVSEGRIDSTGRDTRFSKPVLETNGVLKTFGDRDYGPQVVADYGLDFIERSHQSGKPFLLYYPMILTHCPFSPSPDSPEWMEDDTTVMRYKGKAHYFEDMVAYTDRIVGEINAKLESLNIDKNTLILFTGDNGTDVPIVSVLYGDSIAGAKSKSTNGGTHVPLIVKWPDQIPAGQLSNDLIDFSDVLPTLCELSQIPVPDSLQLDGKSFWAQLKGDKGQPRDWVYNWYSRNGEAGKARIFVRNQRYKLYQKGDFYDIVADPQEKKGLDHNGFSESEALIHKQLKQVLDRYGDRRYDAIPEKDRNDPDQTFP